MTKKAYTAILITIYLGLVSCSENDLSGYWIVTHEISYAKADTIVGNDSIYGKYPMLFPNDDALYIDTTTRKYLFKFEEDSIRITVFDESDYAGYRTNAFLLESQKDSLILTSERETFSLKIERISDEILEISYHDEYNTRIYTDIKNVLVPVRSYNQAAEKDSFITELVGNAYIEDPEQGIIEFLSPSWFHMGIILCDDLTSKYSEYDDWYLEDFGTELFLGISDKIYQVAGLSEKGIEVVSYEQNIEYKLIEKVKPDEIFDENFLIGHWLRNVSATSRDRSSNVNEYYIESIQIHPQDLIVSGESFSDTIGWELNNMNDKVIIEPDYHATVGTYWKMTSLTLDTLVFDRISLNQGLSEVERLIFLKK